MASMDELEAMATAVMVRNVPAATIAQHEAALSAFRARDDAWQVASTILAAPQSSVYLRFFALSVFDVWLKRRWRKLAAAERVQLRRELWTYTASSFGSLSHMDRAKLCTVLVRMGMHDWPEVNATFFTDVADLTRSPSTLLMGVLMIKGVAEEWGGDTSDVLTTQRRVELRQQVVPAVQSLVVVLCNTLQAFSQSNDVSDECCTLALESLQGFLSGWVPLTDVFSVDMLRLIFQFVHSADDHTLPAIQCLSEVLSHTYVPPNFAEYLQIIFVELLKLFNELISVDLAELHAEAPQLFERVTGFLTVFFYNHLGRAERTPEFDMVAFLTTFCKYTFMMPNGESFGLCMECWRVFVEYVQSCEAALPGRKHVYAEGLLGVAQGILQRIQYASCGEMLAELDDSVKDVNGETELEVYQRKCVEVVGLVAELFPGEMLGVLVGALQGQLDTVYSAPEALAASGGAVADSSAVAVGVRDAGVLLAVFARVEVVAVQAFEERFDTTTSFVQLLIHMGKHLTGPQPPLLAALQRRILHTLLGYMHWLRVYGLKVVPAAGAAGAAGSSAATAAAAPPGSPMRNQFANAALPNSPSLTPAPSPQEEAFHAIVASAINLACAHLNAQCSEDVVVEAAAVLDRLVSVVRPRRILNVENMAYLHGHAEGVVEGLPMGAQKFVYRALSNLCVLPPPGMPTSEAFWQFQLERHRTGMQGLAAKLAASQQLGQEQLLRLLTLCTAVVRSVESESKSAKMIVFETLGAAAIPVAREGFVQATDNADVIDVVLEFYLAVFASIKRQMGVQAAAETVALFLSYFSRDDIANQLRAPGRTPAKRIGRKFIELLLLLSQDVSKAFQALLPDIISLCLNQYRAVVTDESVDAVDLKPPYYSLINSLLLNQWRFFFTVAGPQPEHAAMFGELLATLLSALRDTDITLVQLVVNALCELHRVRRLFTREPFVVHCREALVHTVMDVLLSRQVNLLRDELVALLYEVAAVDMGTFAGLLVAYLNTLNTLDVAQRQQLLSLISDTDQPTFTSALGSLIDDCAVLTA